MHLTLLLITVACLSADPSGHWEGSIQAPTAELNFEIDLAKNSTGELAGAFSQRSKNLKGFPLSDIAVEGKSIRFQITGTPGERAFKGVWNGTLDANGKQLRAILNLSNQPDGTATGSIVTVDDGLDIPIGSITQEASSLTLDLKAVGASYSGALNPDSTELAGTYTQGSLVLPLTFRRSTMTEGKK